MLGIADEYEAMIGHVASSWHRQTFQNKIQIHRREPEQDITLGMKKPPPVINLEVV